MGNLLFIHAVGAVGGVLARKKKIPAGAMLGALLFILLLNVMTGLETTYPLPLRRGVQILSGVIIGSRFTRKDLQRLRTLSLPAAILLVMLTGINVLFAWLIARVSDLSAITALFAAAPGGMTDMALIAPDFGANAEQVAILQILRFVVVVMTMPLLMRRLQKRQEPPEETSGEENSSGTAEEGALPPAKKALLALRAVISLAIAVAGSVLAQWAGIPAGAIIGSILATVIFNIATEKAYMPDFMRPVAQIGAGCYIGAGITLSVLGALNLLVVPMLLLILEVFVMTFGIAWIIHRLTGMDLPTAVFSCVPGGLTELGILAEDMRLDIPKVILMHTCRVIFVICMMPILLKLLTG